MGTHPIFESDFDCLTEMPGVLELFRTKWPYGIMAAGLTPAYFYFGSDRFKMKNDWEKEIVAKQFGVQDLNFERRAVMTNTNLTHAMANLEVAEIKKARDKTHQFTYLYARQPMNKKQTEDDEPQEYGVIMTEKLDGRIQRARERAMRKKYKNTYDEDDENNGKDKYQNQWK